MAAPYPGMLKNKTSVPQDPIQRASMAYSPIPNTPVPQSTGAPLGAVGAIPKPQPVPMPPSSGNYQDWGATDQFKHFQANPDVGRSELVRANNQANIYKATGDTEKYNAAMDWIGKVNTVMSSVPTPPTPQSTRAQQQQNTIDNAIKAYQEATQKPFQYNPETDPRYQAMKQLYLARAQAGSKEATRNALETMNDRGIINSSITGTQLGEIEQDYRSRAENEALAAIPEFYNQAMTQRQNDINNASNLIRTISDVGQRDMDNDYRERAFDRGVYVDDRNYGYQQGRDAVKDDQWKQTMEYQKLSDQEKMDYQKWRDQVLDERDKRNFDEDVRRHGLDYAIQRAQVAISRMNAGTSASNANLSARRLDWDMDPRNPDNRYKEASINKMNGETIEINPKESADNYSVIIEDLATPGVTKDKAKQLIKMNRDNLTDSDYRKALDYIEKNF